MLGCNSLLLGLRSSGACSREGRPPGCWAGVSPTLEGSPGAVATLWKGLGRSIQKLHPILYPLGLWVPAHHRLSVTEVESVQVGVGFKVNV